MVTHDIRDRNLPCEAAAYQLVLATEPIDPGYIPVISERREARPTDRSLVRVRRSSSDFFHVEFVALLCTRPGDAVLGLLSTEARCSCRPGEGESDGVVCGCAGGGCLCAMVQDGRAFDVARVVLNDMRELCVHWSMYWCAWTKRGAGHALWAWRAAPVYPASYSPARACYMLEVSSS